ncbi:hypothetical protein OG311_13560 [Streptomyces sp. NBC_01343]|uniref:hypothetical protein n=1 Tax=Streptomyces sp. NBC_01343 TaxID=2903832 RepID=UPI002E146ACD|nr:hypothetical protein OG311_13560 [Streptomyces sp. NBC_01343]
MSLSVTGIFDAMVSHVAASGRFDRVEEQEPKNAPGTGVSAALWMQSVEPIRSSGLAATSGRVEVSIRIYIPTTADSDDRVDRALLEATDTLLTAYSGDFTLGDLVRSVDLLGAYGVPLSAQGGYLKQDQTLYRVMVLTVPLIVNDIWAQSP